MERWVEISEPVIEVYKLWRPTPLIRARRLEKSLDTPAHIYYKYEGVSPVGSHKPNDAVAEAFYANGISHQRPGNSFPEAAEVSLNIPFQPTGDKCGEDLSLPCTVEVPGVGTFTDLQAAIDAAPDGSSAANRARLNS